MADEAQTTATPSPTPAPEPAAPVAETPAPSGGVPEPVAEERKRYQGLNEGFRRRIEEKVSVKRQLREREAELAELREWQANVQKAIEEMKATKEPPPPDPLMDPEGYRQRLEEKRMAELRGEIAPVRQFVEQWQTERQQQIQQYEEEQAMTARVAELRQFLQTAEDDYSKTPEGDGFKERLGYYQRALFDHYQDLGHDADDARAMALQHIRGVSNLALERGFNPAAYLDRTLWHQIGPRTAAQQVREDKEEEAQQTPSAVARAAASGLAGSLAQGGSARGVPARGKVPSVEEVKDALRRAKGKNQVERLSAALASAGRK